MANENLEINIGANTQDLQAGLNQASQSINNFGNAVNRAAKPTADATNALTNLSRVAQDAPYGFMGIANNLNPLLESFQRLQKESGSAGNALKSIASGLMGPAGIGLALGAASSLVVAFGDDISDFFNELISGEENLKSYQSSLEGIGSGFTSAVEKVDKVEIAFQEYHKGILTGKEALKVYNDELGKNFGIKTNINEAEKTFKDKTAAYIEASLQRALADSASKKAAEELLKVKLLEKTGPKNTIADYLVGLGQGSLNQETLQKAAKSRLDKQISDGQKIVNDFRQIAYDAEAVADLYEKGFNFNLKPGGGKKPGQRGVDDEWSASMKAAIKEAEEMIREYQSITKPSKSLNRRAIFVENELPEREDLTKKKLDKDLPVALKLYEANVAKLDKQIAQARSNAEEFAGVLSSGITNGIMSMWDALENGENALEAFGNFLKDMVKQLAAAVIQAILFQSIMSALGFGGASAGGVGGGIVGGLGKILGFADGAVVTQPTLAMVGEGGQSEAVMPLNKLGNMMNSTFNAGAMSGQGGGGNGQFVLKGNDLVLALQRSNYSLNLRRGA
jgi:hypothetical protein